MNSSYFLGVLTCLLFAACTVQASAHGSASGGADLPPQQQQSPPAAPNEFALACEKAMAAAAGQSIWDAILDKTGASSADVKSLIIIKMDAFCKRYGNLLPVKVFFKFHANDHPVCIKLVQASNLKRSLAKTSLSKEQAVETYEDWLDQLDSLYVTVATNNALNNWFYAFLAAAIFAILLLFILAVCWMKK